MTELVFPPDGSFPESLVVDGSTLPAFVTELDEIGEYRSINLVPNVSQIESPAQARDIAGRAAPGFRKAVAGVREELEVEDLSRRRLLMPWSGNR